MSDKQSISFEVLLGPLPVSLPAANVEPVLAGKKCPQTLEDRKSTTKNVTKFYVSSCSRETMQLCINTQYVGVERGKSGSVRM